MNANDQALVMYCGKGNQISGSIAGFDTGSLLCLLLSMPAANTELWHSGKRNPGNLLCSKADKNGISPEYQEAAGGI
jgi:hypothetical protein